MSSNLICSKFPIKPIPIKSIQYGITYRENWTLEVDWALDRTFSWPKSILKNGLCKLWVITAGLRFCSFPKPGIQSVRQFLSSNNILINLSLCIILSSHPYFLFTRFTSPSDNLILWPMFNGFPCALGLR